MFSSISFTLFDLLLMGGGRPHFLRVPQLTIIIIVYNYVQIFSVMIHMGHFSFTRLYKSYNKPVFRVLVYFCSWIILCLTLFETPAVPGLSLPYWVGMSLSKLHNYMRQQF